MSCIYCDRPGPFTDEHVLARAFAGPGEDWMLVDLVCSICNKLFSTYERAWTSAPGEALARIYWGPSGRKRQGVAYQVHPSEHVFLVSDNDPIAYEVDILPGLTPHFRPQLILTANGGVPCASNGADLPRFKTALDAFWSNREITIQKRRSNSFRIARLAADDTFSVEQIELRSRPVNAWLDHFPPMDRVAHDPRISVDAHGRLRIRAVNIKQACAMLRSLQQQGVASSTGGSFEAGTYTIATRSVYDVPKVFRAVAKTIVNYAADEFGPLWISAREFRPILDYCLGRISRSSNGPFVGILDRPTGIPEIDSAPPERHALALACNRGRVIGLVKLYGGAVLRVHLGAAPAGTMPFKRSVWIDYNGPGRVPPLTP